MQIDHLEIPQQSTPSARRCHHLGPEDRRCGSPALRGERFCYYHHETRRPASNLRHRRARQATFPLAAPNSRAELQQALGTVMIRIAANEIDLRRAGLLLYALQTAHINLTEHQRQLTEQQRQSRKPQQPEQPTNPAAPATPDTEPETTLDAPTEAVFQTTQTQAPTNPAAPVAEPTTQTPPAPDSPADDFTPPPPQLRPLARSIGGLLLNALANHRGIEPLPGSPEDRIRNNPPGALNGTVLEAMPSNEGRRLKDRDEAQEDQP